MLPEGTTLLGGVLLDGALLAGVLLAGVLIDGPDELTADDGTFALLLDGFEIDTEPPFGVRLPVS
jgi:hypothetical protein